MPLQSSLQVALLCPPALASGIPRWYHVIQTGYPFLCSFAFLSLGSRMDGIPADLGEYWLGHQSIQCGRMTYLKQLPAIFLWTYMYL